MPLAVKQEAMSVIIYIKNRGRDCFTTLAMTKRMMPHQVRHDIGAGGLGKPGVTGVAYEHPLEGVADGSAGSPTFSVTFRLTKQKSGGGVPHQTRTLSVQFIGLRNNAP